jgi:hypothetical protein
MEKLISDCAKAETSECAKQILCALFIGSWYSEPYHENQNFTENCYDTIKATTNRVMYYHAYYGTFPSAWTEEQGWWVAVATHVGDALTCKVLTKHSKAIYWSSVHFAFLHLEGRWHLLI